MPPIARDDENTARAHSRIGFDDLSRTSQDAGLFSLPSHILAVELTGQVLRLGAHRLVDGKQQARGNIGTRHSASRVHAGRNLKRHVTAVDRLACQSGDFEQRTQPNLVWTLRQHFEPEFGDDPILPNQRDHIGERADRRDFHKRRQHFVAAEPTAQCLHQLERDAHTREVLVGIITIVSLRIDHGDRRRQRRIRLVMICDD